MIILCNAKGARLQNPLSTSNFRCRKYHQTFCYLEAGHKGNHECHKPGGGIYEWPNQQYKKMGH